MNNLELGEKQGDQKRGQTGIDNGENKSKKKGK